MPIAYLPSPSTNGFDLGPLHFHAYGLMIALGALAGWAITRRRWARTGGDPDDVDAIAVWAVPAGLIGARVYHVVSDNELYRGHWMNALKIWDGGLGIWGGVAFGVAAGYVVARRRGLDVAALLDAVAPALPVAQAIGRFGNYFNQELFGRPTTLPWGLRIDVANRPAGYVQYATFHPTFLYEALWDLGLAAVLIWIVPRIAPRLRPGNLFVLYIAGYTLGRVWIEMLRIDHANKILGLRLNVWTCILVFVAAVFFLILRHLLTEPPQAGPAERTGSASAIPVD